MSTKKEILILITFIYLFIFCARVLRVGGTIVLLLSEDHHRHLKGGEASSGPLNSQGGHTEEPGGEERLTPAEKAAVSRNT
mgnify:CR=1 FL=1